MQGTERSILQWDGHFVVIDLLSLRRSPALSHVLPSIYSSLRSRVLMSMREEWSSVMVYVKNSLLVSPLIQHVGVRGPGANASSEAVFIDIYWVLCSDHLFLLVIKTVWQIKEINVGLIIETKDRFLLGCDHFMLWNQAVRQVTRRIQTAKGIMREHSVYRTSHTYGSDELLKTFLWYSDNLSKTWMYFESTITELDVQGKEALRFLCVLLEQAEKNIMEVMVPQRSFL